MPFPGENTDADLAGLEGYEGHVRTNAQLMAERVGGAAVAESSVGWPSGLAPQVVDDTMGLPAHLGGGMPGDPPVPEGGYGEYVVTQQPPAHGTAVPPPTAAVPPGSVNLSIHPGMSAEDIAAAVTEALQAANEPVSLNLDQRSDVAEVEEQTDLQLAEDTKIKCPKCDTVQSAKNKKCTNCGHDLTDARKAKFANMSLAQVMESLDLDDPEDRDLLLAVPDFIKNKQDAAATDDKAAQGMKKVCPECGTKNKADALKCSKCGHSLVGIKARELKASATGDEGHLAKIYQLSLAQAANKPGVEQDGLVWKVACKTGMLALSPGPGQMDLEKPLVLTGDLFRDMVLSMEQKAFPYVTVPETHANGSLENTGYVEKSDTLTKPQALLDARISDKAKELIKLDPDTWTDAAGQSHPMEYLLAGIRFTEPKVKEKALNGSIPDTSIGVKFGYRNKRTGDFFRSAWEHLALTPVPWVDGLPAFGLSADDQPRVTDADEALARYDGVYVDYASVGDLKLALYLDMPQEQRSKKKHFFDNEKQSYPIDNEDDLDNAIRAFGRAKDEDKAALKKYIISRAKALGATAKVPDGWNLSAEFDTSKHPKDLKGRWRKVGKGVSTNFYVLDIEGKDRTGDHLFGAAYDPQDREWATTSWPPGTEPHLQSGENLDWHDSLDAAKKDAHKRAERAHGASIQLDARSHSDSEYELQLAAPHLDYLTATDLLSLNDVQRQHALDLAMQVSMRGDPYDPDKATSAISALQPGDSWSWNYGVCVNRIAVADTSTPEDVAAGGVDVDNDQPAYYTLDAGYGLGDDYNRGPTLYTSLDSLMAAVQDAVTAQEARRAMDKLRDKLATVAAYSQPTEEGEADLSLSTEGAPTETEEQNPLPEQARIGSLPGELHASQTETQRTMSDTTEELTAERLFAEQQARIEALEAENAQLREQGEATKIQLSAQAIEAHNGRVSRYIQKKQSDGVPPALLMAAKTILSADTPGREVGGEDGLNLSVNVPQVKVGDDGKPAGTETVEKKFTTATEIVDFLLSAVPSVSAQEAARIATLGGEVAEFHLGAHAGTQDAKAKADLAALDEWERTEHPERFDEDGKRKAA